MAAEAATPSTLPSLLSMSMITSFFTSGTTSEFSSIVHTDQTSLPQTPSERPTPLKTSIRQDSTIERPSSPTKSVMFAGGEERDVGSDEYSREGSVMSSAANTESKKRKRNLKPKTSYSLCQAPPNGGSKRKLHIRPRPILQLQRLESRGRPRPEWEVIPSARFCPQLTRQLVKINGAKHGLCLADVAIVKAEKYSQDADCEGDDTRDVLALICGGRKGDGMGTGQAKLYFADGSDWEARQLSNGGYECRNVDEHGLKRIVRWVQKKNKDGVETVLGESKRFNFSTISPNSRRHPVIANLSSTSLDVSESYNMPPLLSSQRNSTASVPTLERAYSDETTTTSDSIPTTEELKEIITATAAWVAIREGWCPNFRHDSGVQRSVSTRTLSPSKTYLSPPGSPGLTRISTDTTENIQCSNSVSRTLRAPSIFKRKAALDDRPSSARSNSSMTVEQAAPVLRQRARADTTSTVVIHRHTTSSRPAYSRTTTLTSSSEQDFDDDEGEEAQAVEGAGHPAHSRQSTPTVAATPARPEIRSRASSSRRSTPHYDTSSSEGSDLEHQKMVARQKGKGKKKRGLKSLFCGIF